MAQKLNGEKKLCDRELLEKILSIVEKQEKLSPTDHKGGHFLYVFDGETAHQGEVSEKVVRQRLSRLLARRQQILVHAGGCRPLPAPFPL